MPTSGKSRPFSSGSESIMFLETYCWRCYRYHEDDDNMPTSNSCKIEKAMALNCFDHNCPWPDEIVQTETRWHHCPLFVDKKTFKRRQAVAKPMKNQLEMESGTNADKG